MNSKYLACLLLLALQFGATQANATSTLDCETSTINIMMHVGHESDDIIADIGLYGLEESPVILTSLSKRRIIWKESDKKLSFQNSLDAEGITDDGKYSVILKYRAGAGTLTINGNTMRMRCNDWRR